MIPRPPAPTARTWLGPLAPLVVMTGLHVAPTRALEADALVPALPWVAATLGLLAGARLEAERPQAARAAATAGIVAGTLGSLAATHFDPLRGWGVLLVAMGLLASLWPDPWSPRGSRGQGPALVSFLGWFLGVAEGWADSPATRACLLGCLALAGLGGLLPGERRVGWALGGVVLALTAAVPSLGLTLGTVLVLARFWLAPARGPREAGVVDLVAVLLAHPARALLATFLLVILVGTVLLALPASAEGAPLRLVDAFFTATSAACVTGLGVVDTPSAFSGLGEACLLLLIQVGGLGIMTFSTAGLLLLGRRLGLRQEAAVADLLGAEGRGELITALRRVLVSTFAIESAGALVLIPLFARNGETWTQAVWKGVFHSVSAFCNAGFALQSDSLIRYQRDPWLLTAVMALITTGALGPLALAELPGFVRRGRASLQTRLVLAASAVLILAPALLYAVIEWERSLAELAPFDRAVNALFQSVTLRTAGFNSVDYGALAPATVALMILVMFVGGSPGSTAGGIKTTTAALLLLTVGSAIRGQPTALAFGRRVPPLALFRSAAITVVALGAVGVVFGLLLQTQTLTFEVALFETVSALATVGLSLGGTGQLDDLGKLIVSAAMFLGRVGPITLFLVLADRQESGADAFPEEPVAVG